MQRKTYSLFALLALLLAGQMVWAQGPPSPTNLLAHVEGGPPASVGLTWQAGMMSGPGAFKLFRAVDDSTDFQLLNVVHERSYRDNKVVPGHTYFYYVTAVTIVHDTTFAESLPSSIVSASIPIPPTPTHGVISGTVTDSLTGKPLSAVGILFYHVGHPDKWVPQTWTDTAGHYSAVLDTGTYLVKAQPIMFWVWMHAISIYVPEWYKDASSPAMATPVQVAEAETSVADMNLEKFVPPSLAVISGTVNDSAGAPLKGASVAIIRTMQDMQVLSTDGDASPDQGIESASIDGFGRCVGVVWKGKTDSSGNYHASVLSGRKYIVLAAKGGFFPQYFDHKQLPVDADIISLQGDMTGIDFNLLQVPAVPQFAIGGVVQDSTGVRVPSHILLIPVRPLLRPRYVRFGTTDSLGAYALGHVLAGKYFVLAVPFSKYAPAFYKAGEFGVIRWHNADTVVVSNSDVSGIDIGVVEIHSVGLASVTGAVHSGGSPVGGANVLAMNNTGEVVGYGLSDGTGAYAMSGLPSGQISFLVDKEGYTSTSSSLNLGAAQYSVGGINFTVTAETPLSVTVPAGVPVAFTLGQNYPNPFNPSTTITYALPVAGNVTLRIYNLLGQEVATLVNGLVTAGTHQMQWAGTDLSGKAVASGVYFYRLDARGADGAQAFTSMKKMVLLK